MSDIEVILAVVGLAAAQGAALVLLINKHFDVVGKLSDNIGKNTVVLERLAERLDD